MESFGINRPVMALSVARMADALGNSVLFILIPLYVAKLPSDYIHLAVPIMVGLLISMYGFINSFLQPVMGALVDKLDRRKLVNTNWIRHHWIGNSCICFCQPLFDLFVLRAIQGVGVALTIPASMALMSAITKKETRGGAMGVYSTFRMIGFVLGPIIGGFLEVHFGFNAAFYVGAGFIFLAMLLVQWWVKEVETSDAKTPRRFQLFDISLMSPVFISAGAATFAMAAAFSMVTTLENEFNTRLNMTAFGFSIAFSMLMVGRLIFQMPLGRLSDYAGRKPLILIGLIVMAPATALLGVVTSMTQLIILRLIQGIAAAGIAAPAFALAADLAKLGGEGRQMSIITMGFGLGIAVGPLLAGLLAVFFFELPFIAMGLLCLAGSWIVYRYMPETVERKKKIIGMEI